MPVNHQMLPESILDLILEQHIIRRQEEERLPTSAELFVQRLPGLAANSTLNLFAGHLPAYSLETSAALSGDPHLFFLLARARHIAHRERLIVWFNGGPGCSSMDGALMEIGPVRMGAKGRVLREVENSWNEYADVLFVDQPAGTGYSYINKGKAVAELAPAANQVVDFLLNFFTVFPELSKTDVYLAGESYAGQYIPYIADAMLKSAQLSPPLKGILMGNAWINPLYQYPAYLQYAYSSGILAKGSAQAKEAEKINTRCNELLATTGKGKVLVSECEALVGAVLPPPKEVDGESMCLSSYNIKIAAPCDAEYPAEVTRVRPYLSAPGVKQALHAVAKDGGWIQCNDTVGQQMWSPLSKPSAEFLPSLLDKVDVLIYAGEYDMICNWLGIENTLNALEWRDSIGFGVNDTAAEWSVNGTVAGTWQTSRGLTWVRYNSASHMVPIDQPLQASDMLARFLGIDKVGLSAAGAAAIVPSRVGDETEAIIGATTPEGGSIALDSAQVETPVDFGEQEALDEIAAIEKAQTREAFYGPRRSAVLSLIILVTLAGAAYMIRWLSARHRAYNSRKHIRRIRHISGKQSRQRTEKDVELQSLMGNEKN